MSRPLLASVLTLLALHAAPALAQETPSRVLRAEGLTQEAQSAAYQAAAAEKRHQAMEMLEGMVKGLPAGDPRRVEMLFRLAELTMEEGRSISLSAAGEAPQDVARWYTRAERLYTQILAEDASYARTDEVLSSRAFALAELGREEEALAARVELVRLFPDSPLSPQTFILIGERHFDTGQVFKAASAYQKAVAYRDEHWTAFALYKLAWCQHNLGIYEERDETMVRAVLASAPRPGQSDRGRVTLQEEATRDLVGFLAENHDATSARRVLDRIGRPDLMPSMLARLGEKQFEYGRFEQAIGTWRRLLDEAPLGADAPELASRIYDAHRKLGRSQEALATLEDASRRYGPGSPWAAANGPEAVQAAANSLETDLRALAVSVHQDIKGMGGEARQTRIAVADRGYTLYLERFPEGEHSVDIRYAYAELLYTTRRYGDAYQQYMAVVAADPKGEHAKFCAESAMYAAEKMRAAAPPPAPGTLSEADRAFIAASDQYMALFGGPKARAVTYKVAYLFYERGMLQEASERFRVVIALDPKAQEAEQAANLILDSFVLAKDWDNLVQVSRAFRDQPDLGGAGFKQEVGRIYENARLKQIEVNLGQGSEHRAAGDAYLAFYEEFPASANADLALNNAAARYAQARETARAMSARETLLARFPSSRFYTENLAQLGYEAETLADFPRAAALYEQLQARDPAHPAAKEAIFSAALFRKVMGDWRAASADYQRFLTSYPDDARAPEVRLARARVLDENGQFSEASSIYASFFGTPPAGATADQVLFARVRYAQAQEKLHVPADRLARHWSDTVALFERERAAGTPMELGPDLAAEALYHRLQPTLERYAAARIEAGRGDARQQSAALQASLKTRISLLEEVERGLGAIVETGSGTWGLRALVSLGGAYEDMARALRSSPTPVGLSAEQEAYYRDGVEQRAYAMDQKAVAAYDLCLNRSFELELYGETATAALGRLRDLDPDTHAPLEERILTASFTASGAARRPFAETP